MPKFVILFFSIFCVVIVSTSKCHSQQLDSKDNPQYYQLFDQIVGIQNTSIYNGTEIIELKRVIKEKNKYLFEESFVPATVIFDGQPYYNIDLNYNIYDDIVIIRLKNNVSKNTFKPVQEKIEGFVFGDYEFTNFTSIHDKELNGFYQVLDLSNDVTLLKKRRLERKNNFRKRIAFYEFIPLKSDYFIKNNGTLSKINSKADWINLYSLHNSEIRKYFRKNRKLRRRDLDEFVQKLFISVSN